MPPAGGDRCSTLAFVRVFAKCVCIASAQFALRGKSDFASLVNTKILGRNTSRPTDLPGRGPRRAPRSGDPTDRLTRARPAAVWLGRMNDKRKRSFVPLEVQVKLLHLKKTRVPDIFSGVWFA